MAEPAHRLQDNAAETAPVAAPEQAAPPVAETPAVAATGQPALDVEARIGTGELDLASAFTLIARHHGRTYNQTLVEIAKLSFGPGKLTVDEYLDLGLFDDVALAGADKRSFVGLDVMREIWATVNHNTQWEGLIDDKLAATTLLAGFGFPTIPTRALYAEGYRLPAWTMLQSAADLARFLRDATQYPLFGKPTDGFQSLGSASLAAYDAATDSIVLLNGERISVEAFTAEVVANYASGYILQGRLDPHPAIEAICGKRLATCRIVTVRTETGVEVARSLWKIPAGRNVADNFWRSGNLLGQLEPDTGRVLRVQQGSGLAATAPETHPDTGARILDFVIPDFAELKALACEAHSVFRDINLLGWDIASTANGPVIVEPNITPDFYLPQVIDRRGALDEPMKALIARAKAVKAAKAKLNKKQFRAQFKARRQRITSGAFGG